MSVDPARLEALARRIARNESAEVGLRWQLERAAADVGRLRRRFTSNGGWTGVYLVDQIGRRLDAIDATLQPDAAELEREFFCVCGDHDLAVEEALAVVDRRAAEFRNLLGERSTS